MANANTNQSGGYFYYDPMVLGVNTSALVVKTGSVALNAGLLDFTMAANVFEAFTKPSFVQGNARLLLKLAAPNITDSFSTFGFVPSVGSTLFDSAYFEARADGKFYSVTTDLAGTEQKTEITWDAAWTGALTEFQIITLTNSTVEFWVAGIKRSVHNTEVHIGTPRHLYVKINGASATGSLGLIDIRSSSVESVIPNDVVVGPGSSVIGSVKVTDGTNTAAVRTTIADGASNTSNTLATDSRISAYNGTTWDKIRSGYTSIVSTFLGFLNVISYGVYNASPTARVEGQGGPTQTSIYGDEKNDLATAISGEDLNLDRLATMEKRPYWVRTTTAVTNQVVKASAGSDILVVCQVALTGALTLYNHSSTATTVIAILPIGTPVGVYRIGISCTVGLNYTTAAADAVTVACN